LHPSKLKIKFDQPCTQCDGTGKKIVDKFLNRNFKVACKYCKGLGFANFKYSRKGHPIIHIGIGQYKIPTISGGIYTSLEKCNLLIDKKLKEKA
jgi:DnaJ-class molecular chaperone